MGFEQAQWPPPTNWQDFEHLCWVLWREIWGDERSQKNGRRGQPQHGVDVYGRPSGGRDWAGIQCKGKEDWTNNTLKDVELRAEVKKARRFKPALSQFVIATTGRKDEEIQDHAREITARNLKRSQFSVDVAFWEDIRDYLGLYPKARQWYLEHVGLRNEQALQLEQVDRKTSEIPGIVRALPQRLSATGLLVSKGDLASEHKAQLDAVKEMLDAMKPESAKQLADRLKARAWPRLAPTEKYRLTVQQAAAAWQMGDEKGAGRLLVRALRYNPGDDKALANCALGHLMLGERRKAASRARRASSKNAENCAAYGVIVQTSPRHTPVADIAQAVPESCREKPAVAYGLAHVARQRGELAEAVSWLRKAVANDVDGSPDLKADLGQALLELATGGASLVQAKLAGAWSSDTIVEARRLYEEAWDAVKNTELRRYNGTWLANLANARWMMNDLDGARDAIGEALGVEPDNAKFIKIKAAIALEGQQKDEALRLLRTINSNPETPEASLLEALILGENGQQADAVTVLNSYLKKNPRGSLRRDAVVFRARFLAETGRAQKAIAAIEKLLARPRVDVYLMALAARVMETAGRAARGLEILDQAAKMVDGSTPLRSVMALAGELARRKRFATAAQVYTKVGADDPSSTLATSLLQCYYFAGQLGEALRLCTEIQAQRGLVRRISAMAPAILDEIGDLPAAAKGYAEYLARFPDDFEAGLLSARVSLRLGDIDAVDSFLAGPADTIDPSLELSSSLAYLHLRRGHYRRAIDILYEVRRKYYDNPLAHQGFWGAWMHMVQTHDDTWLADVQIAGVDTAVQVRDEGGDTRWYIIEDRTDADLVKGEIGPNHPVAKGLAGRKEGDQAVIGEGAAPRTLTILKVASKYVWALNDTGDAFEWMFPGTPGIWRFHVDTTGDEAKLRQSMEPVLEQVRRRGEAFHQVEQLYQHDEFFTIGAFASAVGGQPLDAWAHLTQTEDIGLISFRGHGVGGRSEGRRGLGPGGVVVADAVALLTIRMLGVTDMISTRLGRICVVRSTVEMLESALEEARGRASSGLTTLGVSGNSPVMQEIPAQAFKQNVQVLETMLAWIRGNCTIVPVTGALRVGRQQRQEMSQVLGACFVDTMLAAWGSDGVLYSDDGRLRRLALRNHSVPGLWTQQLLQVCLSEGRMSKEAYEDAVIELMGLRYRHTWFNADILLRAARKANWRLEPPFSHVISEAGDESIELPSLAAVIAGFIYRLRDEEIVGFTKAEFVNSLLTAVAKRRDPKELADVLKRTLADKFKKTDKVWLTVTVDHIDAWLKMHPQVRRR